MKSPIKKKTLLSLVSVMVCLIMLVGTAYAYFEYRVTNYGNKITIGGIAAELLKYDEASSQYQDISNGTAGIFNDVTMQAGNTEIVYLQVKNTGTLPLYYDLVLNVSVKDAGGAAADLSSVLQYAVAEDKQAPATLTWSDFAFPVGMTNGKHMPIVDSALAVGDSEYLALAVNLAGGEDDYAGYTIEIDAEVVARDSSSDLLNGDGDFEDGVTYVKATTGGTWVAFSKCVDANVSIVSDAADAPSGTGYLQVNSHDSQYACIDYGKHIEVISGREYKIDLNMKVDAGGFNWNNTKETPATISVLAYDSAGNEITYDNKTPIAVYLADSNGQWISKTATCTMPEGVSYIKIRISGGNNKAAFSIDNIKFYEVTATE